ncbi:MAG: hypothetical protein A2Z68_00330 [Candidatus Nealsonbacteria bacterium RBG_13_38_11]|uniref:HpcH/HpaI aldolase/citrate lyase domain-containing protein n=1 Tax=Candidatus Nealsonbacteria bacterium RBG_13_38_11 TaxID=1801662 RepID=A0A1G2DY60_9BACT|nr:MAG: hypothetical protein A2Z68_00330 [Candidatus Nealsonbacteria bacterium RBG_13_38_11]
MYKPKKPIFVPWIHPTENNLALARDLQAEAEKREVWFVPDVQHARWSWFELENFCASSYPAKPLIRVPEISPNLIVQALQCGARGLMIPQVKSAEEAKTVSRYAFFPPLGKRSKGGLRFDNRYGLMPDSQYFEEAQSILILLQIEDIEAIPAIDEIMSIEGIGGLFIGVEDLTLSDKSYGEGNKLITWDQPIVWEAAELMERAAKKYGKIWGMPITEELYKQKILNKYQKAFFFTVGVNQIGLDAATKMNKG